MARSHASIVAAMLVLGIAACNSTPDGKTLENENKNLQGTIQALQFRNRQLVEQAAERGQRLQELEAELEKEGETSDVVEEAKKEISDHVRAMVDRFRADSDIKVEAMPSGYRFVMTERVLFASGSVKLSQEGAAALKRVADALNATKHPAVIEGHTDNVPVAKPETLKKYPRGNIELSVARSLSVWEFLVNKGKVARNRLSVTGHGPNRPRAGNETDFERWHNRRVEIHVAEK